MSTKYNDLIISKSPKSRFAEAIKTIRTNLAFANVDKDNKVILITSCEPGDGKSFITSNLAIAYAQENKKVLVIDCDLRKGRQHHIFRVHNSASGGYSNLIMNYSKSQRKEVDFDFDYFILQTVVKNVSVIPCGPIPPNPTELLASSYNEEIIKKLTKMFDVILLDCTPVIGLSDAAIMTKYSDINLLIVSNKKTKIELVNQAKKSFKNVNAEIDGVILNKVTTNDFKYGHYYSDKYYGED